MLRLKAVIKASKSETKWGAWESGPTPKSAFPLGKSGKSTLKLKRYEWRSASFTALGHRFRLLVAVHFGKQEYYAHLGRCDNSDTQMMASLEFHGTHPGWHMHGGCGDMELIPVGRYMGPWRKRITGRHMEWGITGHADALQRACDRFNVPPPDAVPGTQLPLV